MSPFLFWIFALMTLIFGAAVVLNRNPVASALSLVLFLFIIMLLNLQAEERRRINWLAAAGGVGVALILLIQVVFTIRHFEGARQTFPALSASTIDDVRGIGALLFRNYNLPFQIVGVLVLVATIGVVLLSKRQPR